MDFETVHQAEIGLMQTLAGIRTPLLDQFMMGMNWFDSLPFYFILTALLWYAYDRKWGMRFFFLYILCVIFNQSMKELFQQPRPFNLAPELGLITANSFGFPSGGAQTAVTGLGYLAYIVRKRWFTAAMIFSILFIGYSRIYIGMHFPTDILGGYFFGGLLLWAYIWWEPECERYIVKSTKRAQCGVLLFAGALLSLAAVTSSAVYILMLGFGAAFGSLWSQTLSPIRCTFQRVLRPGVVIGGFYLLSFMPRGYYTAPLVGLWLSLGAPIFLQKLEALWIKE